MARYNYLKGFGIFSMVLCLMILGACSSKETKGNANEKEEKSGKDGFGKVTLVTNWFAQAEHGGNYTADKKGFYEEAGIDMTIEPGGPQISSTQIVASGKAQFGFTQAEDILIARDKGIPLVVVGAIFQKSPQVLITHKGKGAKFEDLNGKKVYTAPGSGYWEFIKKAYKLDKVKDMAYTGSLATFIDDEDAVTQGYATNEPFSISEQGVDTDFLYIHDAGFETYANVIFTTEDIVKENPEMVKAFMDSTRKGWEYYRDNSDEMNPYLHEKNPELSLDALAYGAKMEEELIFGGDAEEHGFGYMSEERWVNLQSTLLDLDIIKNKDDVKQAYTLDFLGK